MTMSAKEVMKELERMGTAQTRKTWANHGCPEPFFGVKIGDLKVLVKKVKKDTPLAKELYRTGNSDAMYLAGLIGDGGELNKKDLYEWARGARWSMISEYTVAWMAVENPQGWEIALEWIDSPEDKISASGWNTLSGIVATRDDKDLDLKAVEKLMGRVVKTVYAAPNRTRYTMNGFIIAVGSYVKALTPKALEAAARIGEIKVDMGKTACQVPGAADCIKKVLARGGILKKRKSIKC